MRVRTSAGTFAGHVALALGITCVAFNVGASAAEDPTQGDIRDIRVGANVVEIPHVGYVAHRCMSEDGEATRRLGAFVDFRACEQRDDGLREIAFDFDDSLAQWAAVNDKWEGTRVSGHPVNLSVMIDDTGLVAGLNINTDPTARAYMRKKAFLLRLRVLARYGRDGWDCEDAAPADELEPVGGMMLNERCRKAFADRALTLTTRLYRTLEQTSPAEYTNSTRLEIAWVGS